MKSCFSKSPSNRRVDVGPGRNEERIPLFDRGEEYLHHLEGEAGSSISACYQCERCTNACPVSHFMDIKPHQVIRYAQLGWNEKLMSSSTIWVCLSCEMCSTYCPNEVAVAQLMIRLRAEAAKSGVRPKEKILSAFHRTFLNELKRFGRVNETWLMASLNLRPEVAMEKIRNGSWKHDLDAAVTLWRRGRLKLLPHRCRDMEEIRKISRIQGEQE
ncbi:MAG: 4Fe-4S dicluster domain-containing protein [Desulfobacteraceae bacterium]|nr:MAG: 4Fe-4S dicluster domain-containing protein [Desulfobacteraceae bacterium]